MSTKFNKIKLPRNFFRENVGVSSMLVYCGFTPHQIKVSSTATALQVIRAAFYIYWKAPLHLEKNLLSRSLATASRRDDVQSIWKNHRTHNMKEFAAACWYRESILQMVWRLTIGHTQRECGLTKRLDENSLARRPKVPFNYEIVFAATWSIRLIIFLSNFRTSVLMKSELFRLFCV